MKEHLKSARKDKAEMVEKLRLIEMPVDFDDLCEQGLLEKIGPGKFKIPNPKRLPPEAAAKLKIITTETYTQRKTKTGVKTSPKKVKHVGKLWSKTDVKNMRAIIKACDQLIDQLERLSK